MEDRRRARIANCRRAAQRRKRQAPRSDGGDAARAAWDGRERLVAPGGQAGHIQMYEDDERLGQRAEAQGEDRGIHGTVLELRAFAEPVGSRFVNDEIARDGLGQPQDGEQDEAQGEWQSGGALGEAGERDEPGDDPPQRLDIPSCVTHARPPKFCGHSRAGVWGGDGMDAKIVEGIDSIGGGGGDYPRPFGRRRLSAFARRMGDQAPKRTAGRYNRSDAKRLSDPCAKEDESVGGCAFRIHGWGVPARISSTPCSQVTTGAYPSSSRARRSDMVKS